VHDPCTCRGKSTDLQVIDRTLVGARSAIFSAAGAGDFGRQGLRPRVGARRLRGAAVREAVRWRPTFSLPTCAGLCTAEAT
jgi:hypothetical protein